MRILDILEKLALVSGLMIAPLGLSAGSLPTSYFTRIASFEVWQNQSIDTEAVAEIVAATSDGHFLVYTDSANEGIGIVDINDPRNPIPAGFVPLGGEPTSVVVRDGLALVCINTSSDFINLSGQLVIVDVNAKSVARRIELGGQPDSIALSPSQKYAAIAIENERDEDLGNGFPPQKPSGYVMVANLDGAYTDWTLQKVSLDGIPMDFAGDPEPEYIDINQNDEAVVTLQENNHIVLIDLPSATVTQHFSAGTVDLEAIDILEDGIITAQDSLWDIPREPDGATWISNDLFATANEGDLQGGSRGFTIFDTLGETVFDSKSQVEHETMRLGHYPEGRSENKGNETENVEFAKFGQTSYLFVGSERSNLVLVYEIQANGKVVFKQSLPTGVGPEGLLAIPSRNLFVAAAEKDDRSSAYRSTITIYSREAIQPTYPQIASNSRMGLPIPWGALSGLVHRHGIAYAVGDSAYKKSRIFAIDTNQNPARIIRDIAIKDEGMLTAVADNLVNQDQTVNLDLEGITTSPDGGFWLVSEGAGTKGDVNNPAKSPNLLIKVGASGAIKDVVSLPFEWDQKQKKFGFEGVASVNFGHEEFVFVAFQRPWDDDVLEYAPIGRYQVSTQEWEFFYYPLETGNGLWTGLSEIAVDGDFMYIIERDKQSGFDARVKRVYKTPVDAMLNSSRLAETHILEKVLVADLIPEYLKLGRFCPEKIEGMSIANEKLYIINDNDGVDDNSGETTLIAVGL